MPLTRSRTEDEPVAGGVRAAVDVGSDDAGRDVDSGRAIARRELRELNSSKLATPAAATMDLFHRQPLGPAKNRVILATAKERVNQAECVVLTSRAGARRLCTSSSLCWTRRPPSVGCLRGRCPQSIPVALQSS